MGILDACELSCFSPEVARVFENAIERLFYSKQLKLGDVVLPQAKIRSHLWQLDGEILQDAYAKLRAHRAGTVKNSSFYVMVVIFNCIWEVHSDLLVDPYLNQLAMSSRPGGDVPC